MALAINTWHPGMCAQSFFGKVETCTLILDIAFFLLLARIIFFSIRRFSLYLRLSPSRARLSRVFENSRRKYLLHHIFRKTKKSEVGSALRAR